MFTLTFTIHNETLIRLRRMAEAYTPAILVGALSGVSVIAFLFYAQVGLGLAYNDARSHLDIGRRVVEGLKPGLAQLGSVWLPLPHILMIPTIWNDFMWHSGLSGAIQSMIAFVASSYLIYRFLKHLHVGLLGRITGVAVFAANINILYLQSTAMTELLLIVTMTAAVFEFVLWSKSGTLLNLIKSAFWIMLSSLIRYDGWFLFAYLSLLLVATAWKRWGYRTMEGMYVLFATLAGSGIALWFLWNQLIFKDALYFVFGPFSARAQQTQLEAAGDLITKGNFPLSLQVYLYALMYNSYTVPVILAGIGAIVLCLDRRLTRTVRIASSALLVPLLFNILALYLGHSVLFIQHISGNTWFNVRYGVAMLPTVAIFIGFLVDRAQSMKYLVIGLLLFVHVFAFANGDAVTIDDARVGSSQKNVSEISGYLRDHAGDAEGFILISAASHDAIIFSSGLPMKRFIHEGTGAYWKSGTTSPDRWARWVVTRTHDDNDLVWKSVSKVPTFSRRYTLVAHYPFADVYELNPAYLPYLQTKPVLPKER